MIEMLKNKRLLVILGAAFLIRLLIPLLSAVIYQDASVFYSDDTPSYIAPTIELLAKGTYTVEGSPELFRTPGYSVFMIPGILLNNIELVTIVLQIIAGCATVFMVYKLSLLVFENHEAAVLAAGLYAIEPLAIIFCGLLLSETLFGLLLVLFLYFFVLFLKNRVWRDCIASGVIMAACVYVRPIAQYLPLLLFLAALVLVFLMKKKLPMFKMLAIVLMVFISSGIWIVRNGVTSGYYGFSCVTDVNLYSYQGASILAAKENRPYYEVMAELNTKAGVYQKENNLTYAQTLGYMRSEGMKILMSDPFTYGIIHISGMARVIFDPAAIEYLKMLKLYPHRGGLMGDIVDKGVFAVLLDIIWNNPVLFWSLAILFLQLMAYYLLFIFYFFTRDKKNPVFVILLMAVLGYFLVLSGGPHALDRFRHPMMSVICLFAGVGLDAFMSRIKRPES